MLNSTFEDVANKLNGIAAKLEVMAAAYKDNGDAPANKITEAALLSVAAEVSAAQEEILAELKAK